MNTVNPKVSDPNLVRIWEAFAKDYSAEIRSTRQRALELLTNADPIARGAAIESFKYFWHSDDQVVREAQVMASHDPDLLNRLLAVSLLTVLWYRSDSKTDRQQLYIILQSIIEFPEQLAGVVNDVRESLTEFDDYLVQFPGR